MKKRLLVIICLFVASPAYAYLDPGTGSILLQVILGGIAGAIVAIKLFWYKIIRFLGFGSKSTQQDQTEKPSDS